MSTISIEKSSGSALTADQIGGLAAKALRLEIDTWPKPGLVSHRDSGSHTDMDAEMFYASAETLRPFFAALSEAGRMGCGMDDLRKIGQAAEASMLEVTAGVNTHRGAIFGLGLLSAAAGAMAGAGLSLAPRSLGTCVRHRWSSAILSGPLSRGSHGMGALQRYGAGGARVEAAAGFPHVYRIGLPALWMGNLIGGRDENAARVQACFALIAEVEDTNLLHRSGKTGLRFAQSAARSFLESGGVGRADWQSHASKIHRAFIARRLSPGGSADLLAATLFVASMEQAPVAGIGLCHDQPRTERWRRSCQLSF